MITIYSHGLVHCSVCANKSHTKKEIEEYVNKEYPTGTDSQWKVDKSKKFASGHKNPCQCEQEPDNLHYLMVC